MTAAVDLYVFVERVIFETDGQWLSALSELAEMDVPGLGVQVRTKSEAPDRALALAREARAATEDARAPVLLNGSTEEAIALSFGGVHWPEAQIPAWRETQLLLRGASVHSPEAAMKAEAAGADFVVAGTIFDAGSKPVAGEGIEKLGDIAAATALPVLAIGGIRPDRVAECIAAGAAGVAVVTNVLRAPDMTAAVLALREALDEARASEGIA